jgi:hypothetical protein
MISLKKKYWYKTNIYVCVLCGIEKKHKTRVYSEKEKGIVLHDDICWEHL